MKVIKRVFGRKERKNVNGLAKDSTHAHHDLDLSGMSGSKDNSSVTHRHIEATKASQPHHTHPHKRRTYPAAPPNHKVTALDEEIVSDFPPEQQQDLQQKEMLNFDIPSNASLVDGVADKMKYSEHIKQQQNTKKKRGIISLAKNNSNSGSGSASVAASITSTSVKDHDNTVTDDNDNDLDNDTNNNNDKDITKENGDCDPLQSISIRNNTCSVSAVNANNTHKYTTTGNDGLDGCGNELKSTRSENFVTVATNKKMKSNRDVRSIKSTNDVHAPAATSANNPFSSSIRDIPSSTSIKSMPPIRDISSSSSVKSMPIIRDIPKSSSTLFPLRDTPSSSLHDIPSSSSVKSMQSMRDIPSNTLGKNITLLRDASSTTNISSSMIISPHPHTRSRHHHHDKKTSASGGGVKARAMGITSKKKTLLQALHLNDSLGSNQRQAYEPPVPDMSVLLEENFRSDGVGLEGENEGNEGKEEKEEDPKKKIDQLTNHNDDHNYVDPNVALPASPAAATASRTESDYFPLRSNSVESPPPSSYSHKMTRTTKMMSELSSNAIRHTTSDNSEQRMTSNLYNDNVSLSGGRRNSSPLTKSKVSYGGTSRILKTSSLSYNLSKTNSNTINLTSNNNSSCSPTSVPLRPAPLLLKTSSPTTINYESHVSNSQPSLLRNVQPGFPLQQQQQQQQSNLHHSFSHDIRGPAAHLSKTSSLTGVLHSRSHTQVIGESASLTKTQSLNSNSKSSLPSSLLAPQLSIPCLPKSPALPSQYNHLRRIKEVATTSIVDSEINNTDNGNVKAVCSVSGNDSDDTYYYYNNTSDNDNGEDDTEDLKHNIDICIDVSPPQPLLNNNDQSNANANTESTMDMIDNDNINNNNNDIDNDSNTTTTTTNITTNITTSKSKKADWFFRKSSRSKKRESKNDDKKKVLLKQSTAPVVAPPSGVSDEFPLIPLARHTFPNLASSTLNVIFDTSTEKTGNEYVSAEILEELVKRHSFPGDKESSLEPATTNTTAVVTTTTLTKNDSKNLLQPPRQNLSVDGEHNLKRSNSSPSTMIPLANDTASLSLNVDVYTISNTSDCFGGPETDESPLKKHDTLKDGGTTNSMEVIETSNVHQKNDVVKQLSEDSFSDSLPPAPKKNHEYDNIDNDVNNFNHPTAYPEREACRYSSTSFAFDNPPGRPKKNNIDMSDSRFPAPSSMHSVHSSKTHHTRHFNHHPHQDKCNSGIIRSETAPSVGPANMTPYPPYLSGEQAPSARLSSVGTLPSAVSHSLAYAKGTGGDPYHYPNTNPSVSHINTSYYPYNHHHHHGYNHNHHHHHHHSENNHSGIINNSSVLATQPQHHQAGPSPGAFVMSPSPSLHHHLPQQHQQQQQRFPTNFLPRQTYIATAPYCAASLPSQHQSSQQSPIRPSSAVALPVRTITAPERPAMSAPRKTSRGNSGPPTLPPPPVPTKVLQKFRK
eukprot:Awhi_evm1s15112